MIFMRETTIVIIHRRSPHETNQVSIRRPKNYVELEMSIIDAHTLDGFHPISHTFQDLGRLYISIQ